MTDRHTITMDYIDVIATMKADRDRLNESCEKMLNKAPSSPHVHDARCTNCGKQVRIYADDHHHVIGKLIDWLKWVDGLCGRCWSERKDLQK